jgi:hypothetical protein
MINDFSGDLSQNKRNQDQFNYDGSAEQSLLKKPKSDSPAGPSSVLHVRNLPMDCTEQELVTIACPFGRVEKVLLLKGKTQGFVQMQDVQSATALVQYYLQVQANIRGKPVYFQYSQHQAVNTATGDEQSNHILLVTVTNLVYPVTIDILHQVFSKYGAIHKIVIFSKKGFQALIQMGDKNQAQAAKQALDGQNIYSGCCTLRIQYSNLPSLNVKYNNDKSRDFTNNNLPSGDAAGPAVGQFGGALNPLGLGLFPDASYGGYHVNPAAFGYGQKQGAVGMGMGMGPSVLIVNGLEAERVTPDVLFTLFGVYGDVLRVKILYNKTDTALVQFATPQQAETALANLNQAPLFGRTLTINFSKHNTIAMPREGTEGAHLTKDYTGSPLHRFKVAGSKNFQHIFPPGPVLHVSNIPATASEEDIKNLFAQYGRVLSFRFFAKDRRMGHVEMASTTEGIEALLYTHNAQLHDHHLRVTFSKGSQHAQQPAGASSMGFAQGFAGYQ